MELRVSTFDLISQIHIYVAFILTTNILFPK